MAEMTDKIKTSDDICLHAEKINKIYPGTKALDDVSFDVYKGKVNVLIGENGAGKSTLIKVLLGIMKPTSGKVLKDRSLKFSYVPQKFNPSHSLPLRVQDLLALERCDESTKQQIIAETGIEKLQEAKVQQLSLVGSDSVFF